MGEFLSGTGAHLHVRVTQQLAAAPLRDHRRKVERGVLSCVIASLGLHHRGKRLGRVRLRCICQVETQGWEGPNIGRVCPESHVEIYVPYRLYVYQQGQ